MTNLEDETDDTEEIKTAIGIMKMKSYRGAGNVCDHCKRDGVFGSISRYKCESGNEYLICGWCGAVDELKAKHSGGEDLK